MGLKEDLKQNFENDKKISLLRYSAVKNVFVFSIGLFFLNFFILGSNINFKYYVYFLPFTYFFLLISMLYFFYFFIKVNMSSSKIFLGFIYFFLLLIVILLLLPFVFKSGLIDVVDFVKNLIK